MTTTTHQHVLGLAVGVLVSLAFGAASLDLLGDASRARAFDTGPLLHAPGQLVRAESKQGGGRRGGGYRIEAAYSYAVDGVQYEDSRVGFGTNDFASLREAETALDRIKAERQLRVHCLQSKPEVSSLIGGVDQSWLAKKELFGLLAGGLCAMVVVSSGIQLWRTVLFLRSGI